MSNDRLPSAKVMTPRGTLVFPCLNKPDFKFKKDVGQWSARIRLAADDSAALIAKIDALQAKVVATVKTGLEEALAKASTGAEKAKAKKALAELKEAGRPYKPAYDDDGNETGEYVFNFKALAAYTDKNGKTRPIKIDLVDAKGRELKNPPDIWGGTMAIVAGELSGFNKPATGVGVSLRLNGVQILELRTGGQRSDLGFVAQEGYEAPEEEEEAPAAGFTDQTGSPADGAEDF